VNAAPGADQAGWPDETRIWAKSFMEVIFEILPKFSIYPAIRPKQQSGRKGSREPIDFPAILSR
jgi:hypothetical protein